MKHLTYLQIILLLKLVVKQLNMKTNKKIGKKIRELRKQQLFKQIDVALELGMSQSAYAKIENGRTTISVDRLLKIANYLSVEANEILANNKEEEAPYHKSKYSSYVEPNILYNVVLKSKDEQIDLLKSELGFLKATFGGKSPTKNRRLSRKL